MSIIQKIKSQMKLTIIKDNMRKNRQQTISLNDFILWTVLFMRGICLGRKYMNLTLKGRGLCKGRVRKGHYKQT